MYGTSPIPAPSTPDVATRRQRLTWLNQLPAHSIFELDEDDYLTWKQLNSKTTHAVTQKPLGSSSLFPASNTGGSASVQKESFGLDELKDEYQRAYQGLSCMAVHGQDMYVAVGRQVRYASLADLKKGVETQGREAASEYIDSKQHKVLKIQHVDFDIRRLVINQEGKLLAIVGDEKIVIAALPKSIKQDPKASSCKSFILGEFYHINKGPAKIVKVLWHPLSKGFTHVLVMTQDGMLRMYDVATDVDEPEQIFNFGEEGHTSSTYGLDIDDTASFCFGSKYSEWGQLAVYNISDLEEMRESLEGSSMGSAATGKEWFQRLLDSAEPHPFTDEVVIVQSPALKNVRPSRQGPYLYQPAPIELEDDDDRVYDIVCLDTEAVEVLAIAYSSGKVDICIAVERPKPRWDLPRKLKNDGTYAAAVSTADDDLPVISVYETVDLGILSIFGTATAAGPGSYGYLEKRLGIPNHPVLVVDSMYGDTFYIYHETGAHCISVRPWLDKLTDIYEDARQGVVDQTRLSERIGQFYQSKVQSSVGCIVKTRPTKSSAPAPIVGLSVVTDAYLDYSLLLLTSSLQLVGLEMVVRPKTVTTSSTLPTLRAGPVSTQNGASEYKNSLTEPRFSELGFKLLSGIPLEPKVVLPPGVSSAKIIVNEENLEFLGKTVRSMRESLREVYTTCDVTHQRVVCQENEYARQKDKVNRAYEHCTKVLDVKTQQLVDRQDAQAIRQKKLMARADELLRKLMESQEPELSPAEKSWVQEVAKGEKVVKQFDERKHKVQTQYEILKRRLQEMQGSLHAGSRTDEVRRLPLSGYGLSNSTSSAANDSGSGSLLAQRQQRLPVKRYGTGQIRAVEDALGAESQLLDTTMKMIMDVSSRLGVLDISSASPL
ncbi:hypothetical protein BGZ70_000217 [Mortierella alpina]|uniref:Nucleoporin Nup82 n=1 Tax=Mortierella alpina TaxID=64518 RepID=A0A9P6LZ98_MORAP|nr:hypothetical protein BGZ70_000217 [Mortierella alpina]